MMIRSAYSAAVVALLFQAAHAGDVNKFDDFESYEVAEYPSGLIGTKGANFLGLPIPEPAFSFGDERGVVPFSVIDVGNNVPGFAGKALSSNTSAALLVSFTEAVNEFSFNYGMQTLGDVPVSNQATIITFRPGPLSEDSVIETLFDFGDPALGDSDLFLGDFAHLSAEPVGHAILILGINFGSRTTTQTTDNAWAIDNLRFVVPSPAGALVLAGFGAASLRRRRN